MRTIDRISNKYIRADKQIKGLICQSTGTFAPRLFYSAKPADEGRNMQKIHNMKTPEELSPLMKTAAPAYCRSFSAPPSRQIFLCLTHWQN